jgi:hypothetical protein
LKKLISRIYILIFVINIFKGVIAIVSSSLVDYLTLILTLLLYFLIFRKSKRISFKSLGFLLFIFTLFSFYISLYSSGFLISTIVEWYTDIRFIPLMILPIILNTNFNYDKFNNILYKGAVLLSLIIIFQFLLYKLGIQIDIAQKEVLDSDELGTKLIKGKIGAQSGIFSRTVEASYFILLVFLNSLLYKKHKLYEIIIFAIALFLTFKRVPFLIFSASVFFYVIRSKKLKIFLSFIIVVTLGLLLKFVDHDAGVNAKQNEVSPVSLLTEVFSAHYWEKSSNGSRLFIINTFIQNINFGDVLIGRGVNALNDIGDYVDEIGVESLSEKISVVRDVEFVSISLKYGVLFCVLFTLFLRQKIFKYYSVKFLKFHKFYFFMVIVSLLTIRFFNIGIVSLLFWYFLGFRHVENEKAKILYN